MRCHKPCERTRPPRQKRPLLRKTTAAHEVAAAANEQRALDMRTPSEKPDLPKEPSGGVGLMIGEGVSGLGGGVGVGATARRCHAKAPRLLPRLATGCGEAILTAFGPRIWHERVRSQYLGLVFAAAHVFIWISVWYFNFNYFSSWYCGVVPYILHTEKGAVPVPTKRLQPEGQTQLPCSGQSRRVGWQMAGDGGI